MLFNNERCRSLSADYVNSATGLELHRFAWIEDAAIGELPLEWNWLVGEYALQPGREDRSLHASADPTSTRTATATTPQSGSPSSSPCGGANRPGNVRDVSAERDPRAWNELAWARLRAGQPDLALEYAQRAHALSRRNIDYLNTLGIAQAETGALEAAEATFTKALKLSPVNVDALVNLGKVLEKRDALPAALKFYAARVRGIAVVSEAGCDPGAPLPVRRRDRAREGASGNRRC